MALQRSAAQQRPGKCSATNRLIPAKEHGAVQLNVAQVKQASSIDGELMDGGFKC